MSINLDEIDRLQSQDWISNLESITSNQTLRFRPTLTISDDIERTDNIMNGYTQPQAPRPITPHEASDYKLLSDTYEESLNLSVTTLLNRGYKTLGLPYTIVIPTFDNRGFQNGSVITHYQAVMKKGTDA